MRWREVGPTDHRIMPWKNGLGATREIAIDPPDADVGGRFRWRLSIAAVEQSCPFSAFPGYERTIMVIEGTGMDLTVGHLPARRLERRYEPFTFSGDTTASCRLLSGPINDFNLMVDRATLHSRLQVVELGMTPHLIELGAETLILHCFEGSLQIGFDSAERPRQLPAAHTAVIDTGESCQGKLRLGVRAGESATFALIHLEPV